MNVEFPKDYFIFLGNLGSLHSLRNQAKEAIQSRGSSDKLVIQIKQYEKELSEYMLSDAYQNQVFPDWYRRSSNATQKLVDLYNNILGRRYKVKKRRKLIL